MDALLIGRSAERRPLIDELSNNRLLVTSSEWDPEAQCDIQTVDLIHEALITNWPRLRDEIAGQINLLQRRLRFELALGDWKASTKGDQYLLRGIQLKEAKRLSQANDVALQSVDGADLLRRSMDAENRRLRRQRRLAVAISAVLVLLTVAALFAAVYANSQARRARSGELAALAAVETEHDPELGILLALQAVATENTDQSAAALRQALKATKVHASLSHSASVSAIAYSPDGARLITGDDLELRVWDTVSHQLVATWSGHHAFTSRIAYHPQGVQVATANANRDSNGDSTGFVIRLWDPRNGEVQQTLNGHKGPIAGLDYSPDGSRLASASSDGTARVWDLRTGESLSLSVSGAAWDVAFSPDGRVLATASNAGEAKLWDLESGHVLTTFESQLPIFAVAYSPDGSLLATAGNDQLVKLWRLGDEKRAPIVLRGHTNGVMDIDFSPDGKRLVSAGLDNTAYIWDVSNLDAGVPVVQKLRGHQGALWIAQYNSAGDQLATGASDRTVRIWSVGAHGDPINALAFGPATGGLLVTAGLDNTARVWRFEAGVLSLMHTLPHDGVVREAVFSPDGKIVATGSGDNSARLWDAQTGRLLRSLTGHTGEVKSIAFSPDGRLIATAGDDQTTRIWDVASGAQWSAPLGHNSGVNDAVFSPDGAYVATASNATADGGPGQARLWSVADGSSIVLAEDQGDLDRVAFSPDGARLAFTGSSHTLALWDVVAGSAVYTLTEHFDRVYGLAFDETGQRLVTTGNDGRVLIHDAATGELQQELPRFNFEVTGVDFSPDGKYLVMAGRDGVVYVEALTSGDLQQQALRALTRWWQPGECEQLLQAECPAKPPVSPP